VVIGPLSPHRSVRTAGAALFLCRNTVGGPLGVVRRRRGMESS